MIACGSGAKEGELTPEQFVQRVTARLSQSDQVWHAVGEMRVVEGSKTTITFRHEIWTDAATDRARWVVLRDPGFAADIAERAIYVINGEAVVSGDESEASRNLSSELFAPCLPFKSPVVVARLICGLHGTAPPDSGVIVERNLDFHGRRAQALTFTKEVSPNPDAMPPEPGDLDERVGFTVVVQFFVDASTFEPLGIKASVNERPATVVEIRYNGEFLAARAVPPDTFDLKSLPYYDAADETQKALDDPAGNIRVRWLGRQASAGGGLAAMTSSGAERRSHPERNVAAALLYGNNDALLRIEHWPGRSWDDFLASLANIDIRFNARCMEKELRPIGSAELAIFRIRWGAGKEFGAVVGDEPTPTPTPPAVDCPGEPPDRWLGVIRYTDGVVTLNAPIGIGGPPDPPNEANDPEVLTYVAGQLREHQRGE